MGGHFQMCAKLGIEIALASSKVPAHDSRYSTCPAVVCLQAKRAG
jgi:hypothetical protein